MSGVHLTVGVDGSAPSRRALDWAVDEAADLGCDVEIVLARGRPPADAADVEAALARDDHGRAVLNEARERASDRDPRVRTWSRYELGQTADVLMDAGRDAEMVVVGSASPRRHHRSGPSATTIRLITELPRPVCVIPEASDLRRSGPVVVGVDDSGSGVAAMQLARAEAARRGTGLRAVRAVDFLVPDGSDQEHVKFLHRSGVKTAMALIEELWWLTGRSDGAGPAGQHLVQEGRPAEVIIRSAGGAQLIVVGSHGHGLLGRTPLGSVSRQVLQEATIPVIVITAAPVAEAFIAGFPTVPDRAVPITEPMHHREPSPGPVDGARPAGSADADRPGSVQTSRAR